jgi:alkanesulfonate monooxygenase SsuD/methylene tetrahydromethanopterin reductase-like flavin-dependent oxidoreductase (luciferase family)
MKVGLFCLNEVFDTTIQEGIHEQMELVRYAEELEFDEVWFAEHHFNAFSVIPDPSVMLSFASAVTKSIRLGTAGFLAPFYEPIRLAESISMLDNLSNGRIDAGFAKGGFVLDNKHFNKNADDLREVMFENIETIDSLLNTQESGSLLGKDVNLYPRTLQSKIPFFVATFSNASTIVFAANHGYGLLFSQGATIQECVEAQELYKSIAGFYPQMVLMRVFCVADSHEEAVKIAKPSVEHFIKCMRAVSAQTLQPKWDEENYKKLFGEREVFFDGQKFFDNGIIGTAQECIDAINKITKEVRNVHVALKPSSPHFEKNCLMLKSFNTNIRPYITKE